MKIKSKVISALLSTLFIGVACVIDGVFNSYGSEDFFIILIIMFYAAVGNFIYGIPVSLLSDWVSNKVPTFRFFIASFIHISLAVATVVVLEAFYLFAVIAAVFFFIVEEWQHRKIRTFRVKAAFLNAFLLTVMFIGIWGFSQLDLREKTNSQYLIPEGYEGTIVVLYNVPGEKALAEEDGRKIISLHREYQEYTFVGDVVTYVEARTQSHKPEGIVNDTYFYRDNQGERTAIDETCVHRGKSGSDYLGGEVEVEYEVLQVTSTNCGMGFMRYGRSTYEQQERKIMIELF